MNTVHADVTGSGSQPGGSYWDYLDNGKFDNSTPSASTVFQKIFQPGKYLYEKILQGRKPDDAVASLVDLSGQHDDPEEPETPVTYYSSGKSYSRPTSHFTYLDAPYAEAYGMSKATAYQEALAGSSHQREVADLKAAGLNPVLSANGGSGASVFGGTVYSPSASSVSGGRSFGSSNSDELDTSEAISAVSDVIGSIFALTGQSAKGYAISKLGKGLSKFV